nr:hypothetical protein [Porphyromonas macacae]
MDFHSAEKVEIRCTCHHFATIYNSTITFDVVKSYAYLRDVIMKWFLNKVHGVDFTILITIDKKNFIYQAKF